MSKSLNARCIRRWEVEFKGRCDSKFSTVWRKRDLRGYIREAALTTAFCMVERLAERNARADFNCSPHGWSPEFSSGYKKYMKEARDYLNKEATNDEIDEEIENELEAWND
ncbi:TPA: hypothetical protein LSH87_003737 [Citrobacter koseri]|uniref:hypothetical protein n=1 Tax=Citrobacter koseri TaxID=545 RepID=UPI0023AEAAF1|nr:hypothetical protein [Citrobacter koseri]HBL6925828.1 hypothetical protein [Citrobacter koseri]HBL6930731.1 hypothetical protein [Citrobacter koseri]